MARARWAVVAMAVGVVLCAPGCGPGFKEVLIVGHDANGTPVVGAVDCSYDDRIAAEVVSVSTATGIGTRPGREIWRVERPGSGLRPPEIGPPAPPEPEPRFIGGVEMVAIGEPRPSGGDATVALAEPLPDDIVVEAFTFVDDLDPIGEVRLGSGLPNSYEVAIRDEGYSESGSLGLDATGVALLVEDECDDVPFGFDGGVFALVLGIGAGVMLLVAVPVVIVTVRQFRRAGAAAAAAEARRRGAPPPGV